MEIRARDCSYRELYKLLTGCVVPRPIALVSTKSADGIYNLAPFSFFNVVHPPLIMFSIGSRKNQKKDTLVNLEHHPEFVINVVTEDILQQMHDAGADFRPEIDEFAEVKLTPVPAKAIDGIAVKESPIHLECKVDRILPIRSSHMVLAEVVHFVIDDSLHLGNYSIDFQRLRPVARFAGNAYGAIDRHFRLERTVDPDKLVD